MYFFPNTDTALPMRMPAAQYGMREGDLILSVNGVEVPDDETGTAVISQTIAAAGEDSEVRFLLEREGETVELSVPLQLDEAEVTPVQASAAARRLEAVTGEDTEAERIVYLNASKRAMLPEPGNLVTLCCFGRHIRSVEAD